MCAGTHSELLKWRLPADLGAGADVAVQVVVFRIQSGDTEAQMLASTPIVRAFLNFRS